MTTWIDTNVLVSLWTGDAAAQAHVRREMENSLDDDGRFAISACVYAEFLAGKGREVEAVHRFLFEAEIPIAWQTGRDVWELASERFQQYAARRRANGSEPKRFLADFLIGAQATVRGGRLMTFDHRIYAAAFPELLLLGQAAGIPPF